MIVSKWEIFNDIYCLWIGKAKWLLYKGSKEGKLIGRFNGTIASLKKYCNNFRE